MEKLLKFIRLWALGSKSLCSGLVSCRGRSAIAFYLLFLLPMNSYSQILWVGMPGVSDEPGKSRKDDVVHAKVIRKVVFDTIRKVIIDTVGTNELMVQIRKLHINSWATERKIKKLEKAYTDLGEKIRGLPVGEFVQRTENIKERVTKLESQISSQDNSANTIISREKWILGFLILVLLIFILIIFLLIFSFRLIKGREENLPSAFTQGEKPDPSAVKVMESAGEGPGGTSDNGVKAKSSTPFRSQNLEDTETGSTKISKSLHKAVYELKDSGYTNQEIAKELGIGKGEIELILNLRDRGYQEES